MQLSTVSPASVSLGPGSTLDLQKPRRVPLTITLPPSSSTIKVDIALLLDDTGSFKQFSRGPWRASSAAWSVASGRAAGSRLWGLGSPSSRTMEAPSVSSRHGKHRGKPVLPGPADRHGRDGGCGRNEPEYAHGQRAGQQLVPGSGETLRNRTWKDCYQLATGAGFDGNGNGSKLDSGPAGDLATTEVEPGNSGDVPPFSSNVGLTSGSLGGIGWRPGAQHIVLIATDTAPVAAFAGTTIPATITGLDGVSVPSTAFESTAGRVGFVSTALDGTGTGPQPAVVPLGAATVQKTVTALNNLGIQVIGMGPIAAPTTSTTASLNPSTFFSALGRLTGAVDATTGQPLVFSTSVSNSDLTTAIVHSVKTVATQPVDISVNPVSLPAGLKFTAAPGVVPKVGPGGTATFDVTLSVSSLPFTGSFTAAFVDPASGTLLGTIPFQLNLPVWPLPGDPPTVLSGRREVQAKTDLILVTFSEAMNPTTAQNVNNYVMKGPSGGVVAFASATYDSGSHTVILKLKKKVNLHVDYSFKINGVGKTAVCSATGTLLDGMKTGHPGNSYVGKLHDYRLYP